MAEAFIVFSYGSHPDPLFFMDIAHLRTEYKRATLDESQVHPDAYTQFGRWFEEAVMAQLSEPNAMTLATSGPEGRPSARIVLLKGVDSRGFVFFTNYSSRKGRELALQPHAALLFHWLDLERQVRIEGTVAMLEARESDAYYASRPRSSQLGAWASPQSQPIADRARLEALFSAVQARYVEADEPVPRPTHWGGYRLAPHMLEFWQGRASRMHDRIRYRRMPAGGWVIDRLAP